ncbi:hypothetical protein GCM10009836_40840 [Pseudonocardia ailaonensis]|uniref:PIG-L family deacetylase n=1 Tax=Pseudonocardia ailaonensis TaxID=367279 RepID=A0ABN2N888_9PSEU
MRLPDSPRLTAAVDAGAPLLFLSAHLDDGVLSCGSLMTAVAGRCPLTVATLFTEGDDPPYTLAARNFVRQCGAAGIPSLFADRQAEDLAVLEQIGARGLHLGGVDALFRKRTRLAGTPLARIPELVHRYPTYRFDISLGRVSRGDRDVAGPLAQALAGPAAEAALIFVPIGVGKHVDHLLTRRIGEQWAEKIVYFSDFPYDFRGGSPDPRFRARRDLTRWTVDPAPEKIGLVEGYATQVAALFEGGVVPERPETYFEPIAAA